MNEFNPNDILKDHDDRDDYQDSPCENCLRESKKCRICLSPFDHNSRHCECGQCRHMEPIYED